MTIQELLYTTGHRPWGIQNANWKFYQEWNNVIFLHYEVELTELQKYVPKELEIELFNGRPWISVVAFTMEKLRSRNLVSFFPISDFDEINIRTYVRFKGKSGVYFLSIEAGKRISCLIARRISELPYRYSRIKRTDCSYRSRNPEFNDSFDIEFNVGKKLKEKTELDIWLTERYALFQDTVKSINAYEIHHLEWPINEIELKKADISYPRFSKLIHDGPYKLHYSSGVKVLAWSKTNMLKPQDGMY